MLFNLSDGFSGLTCAILDLLVDEFPSCGFFTPTFIPSINTVDRVGNCSVFFCLSVCLFVSLRVYLPASVCVLLACLQ